MDNNSFLTFRKFNDEYSAQEFSVILKENKVENIVVNNSPKFDASFANNTIHNEFLVKIKSHNFEFANKILTKYYEKLVENVDEDYYLFSYSNYELEDILYNSEDWNEYDVALAKKILKENNYEIDYSEIEEIKQLQLNTISKPQKAKSWHINLGYLIALSGGLPGILYGYYLNQFKKTLPNGKRIYNYDESDRKEGKIIMYIGIVSFLIWIIIKYYL